MDDLKLTVANNISALRKNANMTQAELGEKLGYSDKSISKWERAEALPDINVLMQMSRLFDVTVDYMLKRRDPDQKVTTISAEKMHNRKLITVISLLGLLLLITAIFAAVWIATGKIVWLIYIIAMPAGFITLLVFCSIWFGKVARLLSVSGIIWSVLTALYISLLVLGGGNWWILFIIGIPAQVIATLCFGFIKIK